jgi:hypothetical protein
MSNLNEHFIIPLVIINGSTDHCWVLAIFQFLNIVHNWQDSLEGESGVKRPPHIQCICIVCIVLCISYTEQYKENKLTQTSTPRGGFEPTTPKFERAKAAHALVCAATVTVIILPLFGVKLILVTCYTTFHLNYHGHNFLAIFGISTVRNTQFLFLLISALKYLKMHICSLRLILNINFVVPS